MKRLTPAELLEIHNSKGSPLHMMNKYNITRSYVYRIRRSYIPLDRYNDPDNKTTTRSRQGLDHVVISEHGSDPDTYTPNPP